MSDEFHIKYVKREDIDISKWDQCINESGNMLIYAYSFYLDNMAQHWDGLILNNYEAVMPLTWNKKWGIKYLYQPPFTQQLGIFCKQPLDKTTTKGFIEAATTEFGFAEIFFNSGNTYIDGKTRNNFILSLNNSHTNIIGEYKKNLVRNLEYAKKYNLIYESSAIFKEAIDHYIAQYAKRIPHLNRQGYDQFYKLCVAAESNKMILVRKVFSLDNNLLAIALFLKDKRRIYNLMPVTLPEGRQKRANHFLLDQLIKEFSGENYILDFEGSDIPGIARFYEQFGAIKENYYFLRYNNLPFPIKFLKKSSYQ